PPVLWCCYYCSCPGPLQYLLFVYLGFKNKDPGDYSIVLYETANKYHFYHSIALLGASRCRKPAVAGALLVVGMGAFCGALYHQALTENPVLRKLAPYGGMFLIAGWLAIAI
uniref:Transmembrane protein 256 n=1 Tax=Oncorhynchus mykiss TaxID=8022 RepID=A0A8C7Q789_ONCMY